MSRNHTKVLFLVAGLLAAGAGVLAARWPFRQAQPAQPVPPPPKSEQPVLTIDPKHLDFGEVWETDEFELVLPIRNDSANPVRLTEWRNSCNCLGIEPSTLEFGQHEAKSIIVKLDIASKLRMNPTAAQAVAVNFSAVLSDGRSVTWQVQGVVKPLVKVYPDLALHPLSELAQPYPVKQAHIEFAEPVSMQTVESDSAFVTATIPNTTSLQTRCSLELRFSPAIPIGEHQFILKLRGIVPSSQQHIVKQLSGILRVVSDVHSDPSHIVFPAEAIGGVREETALIKSLTGRAVSIESVTAEGDGLTVDWVKGESKLVVRQRSTKTGQATNQVRVAARSDGRMYGIVIPVTSLWINP